MDAPFNCPDGVEKHADELSGTGEIGENAPNEARATFNLGKEEEPDSETFHWNPAGLNPARQSWDQQPEASLAWWRGDPPCEA